MSEKKAVVMCGSFDAPHYTEGVKVNCTGCQDALWLSNSSVSSVRAKVPSIKVEEIETLCLECGLKQAKEEGDEFEGPSQEQLEEVIAAMKKIQNKNREL